MASEVSGSSGNSWWRCCCPYQAPVKGTEREPINARREEVDDYESIEGESKEKKSGSPQPSYATYQTGNPGDGSPMKM